MNTTYLSIIQHERKNNIKNGLYDYVTVTMAYDTGRIEGSTLTLSDTQALYERNVVLTGGHNIDDIVESRNHFELVDFMLDTINESFTERLIKEYHQVLKKGTTDDKRYGVGKYKSIPNIVGQQKVAQPYEVPKFMERLVEDHNKFSSMDLDDILSFHHQFELIHPFQDGNGRVGRIIMLRQSLLHNVTPFIISSDRREEYIVGLKRYNDNPLLLRKEANLQQEIFKEVAAPLLNHYQNMNGR